MQTTHTTQSTMALRITSSWAGKTWEGHVPAHFNLEDIFRYFNRVDEADVERLEAMGYDLPSLSVGDTVTLVDLATFRVASLGWERVEG